MAESDAPGSSKTVVPETSEPLVVPAPPEEPKVFGVPMAMFMRGGGTPTAAYQKTISQEWHASEHQRDQADVEKKLAKLPIDAGGGRMYSNVLAAEGEGALPEAHVLLKFVNPKGEPLYDHGVPLEQVADIKVPDAQVFPDELMLVFFCPRCYERGIPLDHCVLVARQSHRMWHLDARTAGTMEIFSGDGIPFRSAGKIMDSDRLACPACNWACKIDDNKIWRVD